MTQQRITDKHRRMMAGEKVVVSDDDLDELERMPNWKNLASGPNPRQVGTKDCLVAWFTGPAPEGDS